MIVAVCLTLFTVCQAHDARGYDFYRVFEIIAITESGLTLQDIDGNVIKVDRDSGDYKVGYKVSYDTVRKRLRPYRWQDYEVAAVTGDSITLRHKTGEVLTLKGNYAGHYKVGDQVRYDSVGDKLQLDEDLGQWRQYTVVAATRDTITLENSIGQKVTLHLDNNLQTNPSGAYIGMYKEGDPVRYNAATNQLRRGVIRTYDWQYYKVKEVTKNQIILINDNREELILNNTYGMDISTGDKVRYDRINDLLKKVQ